MKKLGMLILLFVPFALIGGQFDTLYVARVKPPSRLALGVFLPGFEVQYAGGKMNIICSTLIRNDSTGAVDTLAKRARLIGVDTSKVEIVYTTEDTLPGDWGRAQYELGPDGRFVRK